MKKMKKASYILLLISTVLFIVVELKDYIGKDRKAPVITCPESACVVSVEDPESVLLQGVTAKDNRSGDVSESVVVEKISPMSKDGTMTITYASIDESGNVGRKERKLEYTDYTAPVFNMKGPLRVDVNKYNLDYLNNISASSSIDGDLTGKIKFNFVDDKYVQGAGDYELEFKVTDSRGTTSVLKTWLKVYDSRDEKIKIELSQYMVRLNVNDSFDPMSYYVNTGSSGSVSVETDVDVSTPGTYYADYKIKSGDATGSTRLVVIVE